MSTGVQDPLVKTMQLVAKTKTIINVSAVQAGLERSVMLKWFPAKMLQSEKVYLRIGFVIMVHVKTLATVIAVTALMVTQAVTVRQKSMSVTQLPVKMVQLVVTWLGLTVVSVPKVSRVKTVN